MRSVLNTKDSTTSAGAGAAAGAARNSDSKRSSGSTIESSSEGIQALLLETANLIIEYHPDKHAILAYNLERLVALGKIHTQLETLPSKCSRKIYGSYPTLLKIASNLYGENHIVYAVVHKCAQIGGDAELARSLSALKDLTTRSRAKKRNQTAAAGAGGASKGNPSDSDDEKPLKRLKTESSLPLSVDSKTNAAAAGAGGGVKPAATGGVAGAVRVPAPSAAAAKRVRFFGAAPAVAGVGSGATSYCANIGGYVASDKLFPNEVGPCAAPAPPGATGTSRSGFSPEASLTPRIFHPRPPNVSAMVLRGSMGAPHSEETVSAEKATQQNNALNKENKGSVARGEAKMHVNPLDAYVDQLLNAGAKASRKEARLAEGGVTSEETEAEAAARKAAQAERAAAKNAEQAKAIAERERKAVEAAEEAVAAAKKAVTAAEEDAEKTEKIAKAAAEAVAKARTKAAAADTALEQARSVVKVAAARVNAVKAEEKDAAKATLEAATIEKNTAKENRDIAQQAKEDAVNTAQRRAAKAADKKAAVATAKKTLQKAERVAATAKAKIAASATGAAAAVPPPEASASRFMPRYGR